MPEWIVVGAGTGGTSATIGRYLRYRGLATRLAVVDPQGSAFLPAYAAEIADTPGSRIEGIGRPRVEPSFVPRVVDRMIGVPDAASVAAMLFLDDRFGLRAGPSTGTNLYGALMLACELRAAGRTGSIVTLMCDRADRYAATFWDADWRRAQSIDPDTVTGPGHLGTPSVGPRPLQLDAADETDRVGLRQGAAVQHRRGQRREQVGEPGRRRIAERVPRPGRGRVGRVLDLGVQAPARLGELPVRREDAVRPQRRGALGPGGLVELAARAQHLRVGLPRRRLDQVRRDGRDPARHQHGDVAVAAVLAQRGGGLPQRQVRLARPGQHLVGRGQHPARALGARSGLPGQLRGLGRGGRVDDVVAPQPPQRRTRTGQRAASAASGVVRCQASGSARPRRSGWKPKNAAVAISGPTAPSGADRWAA